MASGVLSRLIRGNEDSALNYLAVQSGVSKQEAQARLERLKAELQAGAQKAADAAKTVGWLSFGLLLFGSISALLGGGLGTQVHSHKHVEVINRKTINEPSHAL